MGMEEVILYGREEMENCSYREVQQLAKSMKLPSNVKKIYLIELVVAKQHGTEDQVNDIIQKVNLERQQASRTNRKKKKRNASVQGTEVSSTDMAQYPAIDLTPKRQSVNIRYSEQGNSYNKARNSQRRDHHSSPSSKSYPTRNKSDRVLRSYNMKQYKKTIQKFPFFDNTMFSVTEGTSLQREHEDSMEMYEDCSSDDQFKMNSTTRCVVNKSPCLMTPRKSMFKKELQLAMNLSSHVRTSPVFLRNKLSKTYPVKHQESPLKTTLEVTHRSAMNNRCNYQITETTKTKVEGPKSTDFRVSDSYPTTVRCENPSKRISQMTTSSGFSYPILYPFIKNQGTQTKSNYEVIKMKSLKRPSTSLREPQKTLLKKQFENANNYPVSRYETPKESNYEAILNFAEKIPEIRIQKLDAPYEKKTQVIRNAQIKAAEIQCHNLEVTVQDIINSNIDAMTFTNPNLSEYVQTDSNVNYPNIIRAEQVKSQRRWSMQASTKAQDQPLPNISEVFSKFKDIRKDLTQPLYVQVSEGSERTQSYPVLDVNPIEYICNYKHSFLTGEPYFKTATTSGTTCVYSTPIMTTAGPVAPPVKKKSKH